MSAPEPKAWEATDDEVLRIVQIECRIGDATEEMNKVFATVARRRALAELRALAKVMCSDCGKGVGFTVHPFEPKTHFHNGEDLGYWECQCPEIHERIAAIEAEEA